MGVSYKGRSADRKVGINYTPQSGDIIIFDWSNDGYNYSSPASAYGDHVGIVEYVKNGEVHTIEGNSSDSVKRNSYSLNSSEIKGYGVPNYTSTHEVLVTTNKKHYSPNEIATWSFDAEDASSVHLYIYKDGNKFFEGQFSANASYSRKMTDTGHYAFHIIAHYVIMIFVPIALLETLFQTTLIILLTKIQKLLIFILK